jgi:hypothetical protein
MYNHLCMSMIYYSFSLLALRSQLPSGSPSVSPPLGSCEWRVCEITSPAGDQPALQDLRSHRLPAMRISKRQPEKRTLERWSSPCETYHRHAVTPCHSLRLPSRQHERSRRLLRLTTQPRHRNPGSPYLNPHLDQPLRQPERGDASRNSNVPYLSKDVLHSLIAWRGIGVRERGDHMGVQTGQSMPSKPNRVSVARYCAEKTSLKSFRLEQKEEHVASYGQ